MRGHAPAGVNVALQVVGEGARPDAQDPGQVRGTERAYRFPSARCDLEPLDARRDLPAARDEYGTAVCTPPDDGVVGSRAGDEPRLAPLGRIERESASTRLDEDLSAVGRYESLARAFRGHGAGLAAGDVLHVAPDPFAVFMTAGVNPLGGRAE